MEERDRRFINLERKIGRFVLIAITGILLVVVLIGMQQDVFTPKSRIYFFAYSGTGLNEGQAVKFKGFKIGKVERVSLTDFGKVEVTLSISRSYMKWIKEDSKAKLMKEMFIGDSIIVITPGSDDEEQLKDEGVVVFEREREWREIAESLVSEVKPMLLDIKSIIHDIQDPQGDFKSTLRNLKTATEELVGTRKNLDTLLVNADRGVTDVVSDLDVIFDSLQTDVLPKMEEILGSAGETVSGADSLVKRVDRDLPGIVEKLEESLENIRKITDDLKEASPMVPYLLDEGEELIDKSSETMDSVQDSWLFRKKAEPPKSKTLEIDSYE
jgi:phospholipid/cholesterol/gamma-HCH transport system substrate-binding protein